MKPFKFSCKDGKYSASGFKISKDRYGKWRVYHRKLAKEKGGRGAKIDVDVFPIGSPEFFAEAKRIYEIAAKTTQAAEKDNNTLGALFEEYRKTERYINLSIRSRHDMNRLFYRLEKIQHFTYTDFDTPFLYKLQAELSRKISSDFSNRVMSIIGLLLKYAVKMGYIKTTPMQGFEKIELKKHDMANRPWTQEEIEAVINIAPLHIKAPIVFMLNTGLAPVDTFRRVRSDLIKGVVTTRRSKTKAPVGWAISDYTNQVIEEHLSTHDNNIIFANTRKQPWGLGSLNTASGFNSVWQRLKRRLAEDGKVGRDITLYGLRHTMAVIIRERGVHKLVVAEALGHTNTKATEIYLQGANLSNEMREASNCMNGFLSNLQNKSVELNEVDFND